MNWPDKFDIIVGNPPYQGGNKASVVRLWHRIIKRAREATSDGGYGLWLIPNSFYANVGEGQKLFQTSISDKNLLCYKHLGKVWPGVGIDVCFFLEENMPYKGKTQILDKEYDLREGKIYFGDYKIEQDIINKVIHSRHPRIPLEWDNIDKDANGQHECLFSGRTKRMCLVEAKGKDRLKLVIPFSSSYMNQFITSEGTGKLNKYHLLQTEEQGQMMMSYTKSFLYKFVANKWAKTSGFCPFVLKCMLPMLEARHWTEEEIWQEFGLSAEEQEHLKSKIK
jgi:hypothetical protein